jgi:amphi-Trp domain-containing protein
MTFRADSSPGRHRINGNATAFISVSSKNVLLSIIMPPFRRFGRKGGSMAVRKARKKRDIEKAYPTKQFVAKLRRLADAIEGNKRFRIQVGGERVSIPPDAVINIEHERGKTVEEIEFQLKWKLG